MRVDIFYQRLSFKNRAWVNLVGVILFLIPGCLLIIYHLLAFRPARLAAREGSPDPGGIPYRFIVKSLIPIGFGLLLLQGISLGIHSLLQILGIEKPPEKDH